MVSSSTAACSFVVNSSSLSHTRGKGIHREKEAQSKQHLGAVLEPKRHQKLGLRVASRLSWISDVRHRYITATTCGVFAEKDFDAVVGGSRKSEMRDVRVNTCANVC